MLPVTDSMMSIDIAFKLNENDRLLMSSHVKQEGFHLTQKLMEDEIRKLNVYLLNADTAEDAVILARFRTAKAAAMFYAGFLQRLREEISIHVNSVSGVGTMDNPEVLTTPQEFE